MKDQLKTIRDGIEKAHIIGGQGGIDKALTALDQLEAMEGDQEPVAYLTRDEDGGEAMLFFDKTEAATYCEEGVEPEALVLAFAAPAAQQPQAEAITEAAIDAYLDDYEMRGETEDGRDACYTPSEREKFLIKDAIMGLLAETPPKQPQAEAVPDEVQHVLNRLNSSDPDFDDCAEAATLIQQMADALRSCSGMPHWPSFQPLINEASKWRAEAVPPTHVLVPVEPTEAMMDAAVQAICYGPEGGFTRISGPQRTWKAMIDAAKKEAGHE